MPCVVNKKETNKQKLIKQSLLQLFTRSTCFQWKPFVKIMCMTLVLNWANINVKNIFPSSQTTVIILCAICFFRKNQCRYYIDLYYMTALLFVQITWLLPSGITYCYLYVSALCPKGPDNIVTMETMLFGSQTEGRISNSAIICPCGSTLWIVCGPLGHLVNSRNKHLPL